MEGYQNTEIGLLPNEWDFGRIDDYFTVQQGKQVSKSNRIGENQKPFLRTSNILWEKIVFDELDHMHFSGQEEVKFQLEKNDLLVCEGGDIGRSAIWNNEVENCYYQNHLHRLRAKTDLIDPLFILHWLQYSFVYGNIYFGRGNITTIPNLSKSRLSELIIPQPELPEQRKIAHVLSKVQKAIEQQDKLIRTTSELKKALMQKLFTEGTRGEPQRKTNIGLVPESWEVVEFEKLVTLKGGFAFKSKEKVPYSNTQLIRMGNLYQNSLDLSRSPIFYPDSFKNQYSDFVLKKGDLIMSLTGTMGKEDYGFTVKLPKTDEVLLLNQRVAKFVMKTDEIIKDYLKYYLLSRIFLDELYKTAKGTKQANLSSNGIKKLHILVPNKVEQELIVRQLSILDTKIEFHQTKKQTLTALFKTLLHELMTGQRRVHEFEFN